MSYTPGINISSVTVSSTPLVSLVSPNISNPYIVTTMDKKLLFPSGVSYSVSTDASGRLQVNGVDASGRCSLSHIMTCIKYGQWIMPYPTGTLTASFVYTSGIQNYTNVKLEKSNKILPRDPISKHILYIAGNALSMAENTSLATAFTNADLVSSTIDELIANQLKSKLESQTCQGNLIRAIIDANGPVVQTTVGNYSYNLDGTTTDLFILTNIQNMKLQRMAYGVSNVFAMQSSIPLLIRLTNAVPIVDYDADAIGYTVSVGSAVTTIKNQGSLGQTTQTELGSENVATAPVLSQDASGCLYLSFDASKNLFYKAASNLPLTFKADGQFKGMTVALVFRFNGTSLNNEPVVNSSGFAMRRNGTNNTMVITGSSPMSSVFTNNLSTLTAPQSGFAVVMMRIQDNGTGGVLSSYMINGTLIDYNVPSSTIGNGGILTTNTILGNFNGDVKCFQIYDYALTQNQMRDVTLLLARKYNIAYSL